MLYLGNGDHGATIEVVLVDPNTKQEVESKKYKASDIAEYYFDHLWQVC